MMTRRAIAGTLAALTLLLAARGGSGSDGILAIEIMELPATATNRQGRSIPAT